MEERGNGERNAGEMLELFHCFEIMVAGPVDDKSRVGDSADIDHRVGVEIIGCVTKSAIVHSYQ